MNYDGWLLVVGVEPLDVRIAVYRTKKQATKVAAGLAVAGAEVAVSGFYFVPEDFPPLTR